MDLTELVDTLHNQQCSCAIWSEGRLSLFHGRGISDLYALLTSRPSVLKDALIADKVIGKGAAALMTLGKVKSVYADVISRPALDLFEQYGLSVRYNNLVANIINRAATGICPVETLCIDCHSAEECLPLIEKFMKEKTN